MKKNYFIFMCFLLFALTLTVQAQKIGYIKTDFSGKPKDLTKIVLENCKQSLREDIDDDYVEIKYDKASENTAKLLFPKLKESFLMTRKLLQPLKNFSARIYLIKLKDVPQNYEIEIGQENKRLFVFLLPYKNDINFDCEFNMEICKQIYNIIPHELTHVALDNIVGDVSWFQEGLAEYVGFLVSTKFAPKIAFIRNAETLPEVSLNNKEIRENLFNWSYSENAEKIKGLETLFFYGASHQLIKLLVNIIDENLSNQSLLLSKIIEKRKLLNSQDILQIIENDLHINIKTLGILSKDRENELFINALNLYQKERNSDKTGYKFTSLATISYLKGYLPSEYFEYFFADVLNDKNDVIIQCFASKAILKHFDQENFDVVFRKLRISESKLKKFETKDSFATFLNTKLKQ